jgi:hypothetical protein
MSALRESIATRIIIHPVSGEWIWTGPLDKDGYGRIGKHLVHREVYELLVGPIPDGLTLDHVRAWGCTSRACCSPWCLEPVTRRENILRGTSPAVVNARKVRCDHGHRFTRANTYVWQGKRSCRICTHRGARQYRRQLREAAAPLELGRAA